MTNSFRKMVGSAAVMMAAAMVFAACGSKSDGNVIKGNLSYNSGYAGRMLQTVSEPLTDVTVELVDDTGKVVATTTVNSNGDYTFTNVEQGGYTVVVKDVDGNTVAEASVTVADGDNAVLSGTFTDTSVTWNLFFEANSSSLNDTQKAMLTKLAELSGVSESDILQMRLTDHMGWGVIAKELGLHPGQLGMGHPDGWEPKRTKPATGAAKSTKSGKGKGNTGGGGNSGGGGNAGGGQGNNPKK